MRFEMLNEIISCVKTAIILNDKDANTTKLHYLNCLVYNYTITIFQIGKERKSFDDMINEVPECLKPSIIQELILSSPIFKLNRVIFNELSELQQFLLFDALCDINIKALELVTNDKEMLKSVIAIKYKILELFFKRRK